VTTTWAPVRGSMRSSASLTKPYHMRLREGLRAA
jgi:protein gp37